MTSVGGGSRPLQLPATLADEQSCLGKLRASLDSLSPELTPEQKCWSDDACLLRYLRARKFDHDKALVMIRDTLTWRLENDVHNILPARRAPSFRTLTVEARTGKMYVLPAVDSSGRAVVVMRPGLENSKDVAGNIHFLTYTLERASRICTGRFVIIIDYGAGAFSLRNAPSLSTSKATLAMIQNHFPERLGAAVMVDPPAFFFPLFRLVRPLIDPVTAAKIHFVNLEDDATHPVKSGLLDSVNTPTEYGGELSYEFNPESYFDDDAL
jgi:CRAL/TRIO domain/CRAL/TRIO, N-terminal domain